MKARIALIQLALLIGGWLASVSPAAGALYGIYESYVVINANGGGNVFYDAGANTGNPNFPGANLGAFNPSINTLVLNGGEVKTWKDPGGDVTGVFIAYRIWKQGNESGSFTERSIFFHSNLGGGDQKWQLTGDNINVLSGLGNGDYKLEVYFRASGNQGNVFDNVNGANYEASFTVVPEPTHIALGIFGALFAGGAAYRKLRQRRS